MGELRMRLISIRKQKPVQKWDTKALDQQNIRDKVKWEISVKVLILDIIDNADVHRHWQTLKSILIEVEYTNFKAERQWQKRNG